MKKQLKNRDKLLDVIGSLESFLEEYDCKSVNCEECEDKKICDYMYRLDIELIKYFKKAGSQ